MVRGIHKNPNCQCPFCKNKRREGHKPNCQCAICRCNRGEYKGVNSPNYGRTHKSNCQCFICKSKRGEYDGSNRLGMTGKHHSKETKRKISESRKRFNENIRVRYII